MTSYQFWTEQAERWNKCVDYGSPMSAWTQEMHCVLGECGGDRLKATQVLRQRKQVETTSLPKR